MLKWASHGVGVPESSPRHLQSSLIGLGTDIIIGLVIGLIGLGTDIIIGLVIGLIIGFIGKIRGELHSPVVSWLNKGLMYGADEECPADAHRGNRPPRHRRQDPPPRGIPLGGF
eukprot:5637132-Pyramimonas_sp.AAC.1